MTPEEQAKEDAWARRAAELDDGGPVSAGGWYVKLQKFPPPNLTGLTPKEVDAAVAKWVDLVTAWEREVATQSFPTPAPTTPTNALPTQTPVA